MNKLGSGERRLAEKLRRVKGEAMEKEEERKVREEKRENAKPKGTEKKNYVKLLEEGQQMDQPGGKFMSCHSFSHECSQVKAAFVPRRCVNGLIYPRPHPCTRHIPRSGPAAAQMR